MYIPIDGFPSLQLWPDFQLLGPPLQACEYQSLLSRTTKGAHSFSLFHQQHSFWKFQPAG